MRSQCHLNFICKLIHLNNHVFRLCIKEVLFVSSSESSSSVTATIPREADSMVVRLARDEAVLTRAGILEAAVLIPAVWNGDGIAFIVAPNKVVRTLDREREADAILLETELLFVMNSLARKDVLNISYFLSITT